MGAGTGLLWRLFGGRGLELKPAPTKEVGTSSSYEVGGYLHSTERNPKAKGPEKWRTYSDLLGNVAIVAAGTRAFLNLVSKSAWTLVPATMENEADQIRAKVAADLVDAVIHDLRRPWSRVVRRSAMYRFFGFSIQEWTAKKNADGTVGLLDVAPRPQATIARWNLDEAGNVLGMTQIRPRDGMEVYLPREKVVHVVDDALSDSPEGVGLFRHLIDAHYRLERYQLLEAFGFETDLKGIPVGRAPYAELRDMVKSNALSEAERLAIVKPLEDLIANHIKSAELGVALDSSPYRGTGEDGSPSSTLKWGIELMTGSPTSAAEVAKAIERLTRDIALVLGVQGLLLGGDGSGSLALGRVFADQFANLVDSALAELAQAYEHDIIPVILALNGIDQALAPTFATEQVQFRDVEQITQSLRDLADAGAPLEPDDEAINTVRSMLGLPQINMEARARDSALEDDEEPDEEEIPAPEPAPDENVENIVDVDA